MKTKAELVQENCQLKAKLHTKEIADEFFKNTMTALEKTIKDYEAKMRFSRSGSIPERVTNALHSAHELSAERLSQTKSFRDDVIVELRAIAITIDSSLKAQTHGEKNARLRGTLEVIEGIVANLRKERFDFDVHYWDHQNLFRSESVTKYYVDKIRILEHQLAAQNHTEKPPPDEDVPY